MVKIGTDIVEISRIAKNMENDAFFHRIYTEQERRYILSKGNGAKFTAAGIFCAKEAVAKAAGSGITTNLSWKDIEIFHNKDGTPQVRLPERMRSNVSISISHCREYATAVAVWSDAYEN